MLGTARSRAVSRVWGAGRARSSAPAPGSLRPHSSSAARWVRARRCLAVPAAAVGSIGTGGTEVAPPLPAREPESSGGRQRRGGVGVVGSCLCCCVGCCVVQLEGHRVGEGCGVPSPREKLGQGGIWGRGLGTDWRGRRLRARLGAVPPTAIYTGAPACFLLEMSPPILSPLLPFPVLPFPSVSPAVGLALCLC